jgi:hypothetical protein
VSSLVWTWDCRTSPNTGNWLNKVTKIGSRNSDTSFLYQFVFLFGFPHRVLDNFSDVSEECFASIFRVTDFGPHGRWTSPYNRQIPFVPTTPVSKRTRIGRPEDGGDYCCHVNALRGGVVVKALRYKPAGRGFDSRWCHNFSVT